MRRLVFVLVAVVALAGVVAYMASASGQADGEAAPIFVDKIPSGYRDWRLISVAHEEGKLNDLARLLLFRLRRNKSHRRPRDRRESI